MDKLELQGKWNEIKGKVKQAYADLTEDDLKHEEERMMSCWGNFSKKQARPVMKWSLG